MNTRALELRKRHPASAGTPVPESEENRHEKDQMEVQEYLVENLVRPVQHENWNASVLVLVEFPSCPCELGFDFLKGLCF